MYVEQFRDLVYAPWAAGGGGGGGEAAAAAGDKNFDPVSV